MRIAAAALVSVVSFGGSSMAVEDLAESNRCAAPFFDDELTTNDLLRGDPGGCHIGPPWCSPFVPQPTDFVSRLIEAIERL